MVTIDQEKLNVNYQQPLGTILIELKKNETDHKFDECMDKDIRNAIAHGWYWWDNDKFVYTNDKKLKNTKEISLGELFIKHREISLLLSAFNENAFELVLKIRNQRKNSTS